MMTKKERFVTALRGGTPDKVPFILATMYRNVAEAILGHPITGRPVFDGMNNPGWLGAPEDGPEVTPVFTGDPEVCEMLGEDATCISVQPPMFVKWQVENGSAVVAKGLIDGHGMYIKCKNAMPDPDDSVRLDTIKALLAKTRDTTELAVGAKIRTGIAPTLLSLGMDTIAEMVAEEDETLELVAEMYMNWSARFNKNLNELGFDFFWTADDIAFDKSMLVSPAMWRSLFKERLRKVIEPVSVPFLYHSDGNFSMVLNDLIEIGVNCIHPFERGSMDQEWLLENYKKPGKLAFCGNVDINHILFDGTIEEVYEDVKTRIETWGPGGGYIICDSNSIPGWCNPQNVIAMAEAVEKYRYIY